METNKDEWGGHRWTTIQNVYFQFGGNNKNKYYYHNNKNINENISNNTNNDKNNINK